MNISTSQHPSISIFKTFPPLLLFVILLFASLSPQAQITHTAKGDIDENANKVLKKAPSVFEKSAVSFSVTMINRDSQKKETARQKADVLYSKGRYRVTTGNQTLYSDGSSVWQWDKSTNEVTINTVAQGGDDLLNPAALLTTYSKNFKVKFIREEDGGVSVIDLTPYKSKSYYKIRMFINSKNGHIKQMEIHNYDSSEGIYQISAFKTSAKCNDKDFVFDASANKGVEIIDMR